MYIDSHAHLFDEDYQKDLDDVIGRARNARVQSIVVPGTTLETSKEAVELAHRYDFIYACVGYHPHEASKATDEGLAEIEELSKDERVVAIGEIGLDFHYDFSPRDRQRETFKQQIEMARRRNLPVVIHTRESLAESIAIVEQAVHGNGYWLHDQMWSEGQGEKLKGVFHCFTGDANQAGRLFECGFLVSFPGIVTFKNSPVVETLKQIGFKNILVETDSPYLTPVPFRGKRNEPSYVTYVAGKIAEIFGVSVEEIAQSASDNTKKLFHLH